MAGYVPLFDSLTRGTLCGRWPDIGLWPIVLSLSDRNGHVDVTTHYLAGVTGLPVLEVAACMVRFCEPDFASRSKDQNGARLVLLDEHRDWGWRVVNHTFYREKARKSAFDAARVEDGRNKERMGTRADPRSPAKSPADPPSDSNANTNKEKTPEAQAPVVGLDLKSWNQWLTYRSEIRKPIKPVSIPAAQRKLAGFGANQAAVVENSIANSYQGLIAPKTNGHGGKVSEWE